MQIILGLLAVLGGAAFWWWRIKVIGEAAGEVTDVAGRVWGKYKRHKFRKKVEDSPLEAVDDPAAAAVVMMLAIAQDDGPLSREVESMIRREIISVIGIADPTELLVFGKWVTSHVVDVNNVSMRYSKLWNGALSVDDRRGLADMVERIAEASGPLSPPRKAVLHKLRERLGLLT